MRHLLFAVALSAATAVAQGTNVDVRDVGLTMQVGPSTGSFASVVGQRCGPFTCVPFSSNATVVANSLVRPVRIYGDANSLYVLAMSTGPAIAPCVPIPGIGNALILGQPAIAISIGVTGPYLPSTSVACRQGGASYQLQLPPVSPAVIPFLLQAVTYSFSTQAPAFTVAVRGFAR